jgi:hypothetical protein
MQKKTHTNAHTHTHKLPPIQTLLQFSSQRLTLCKMNKNSRIAEFNGQNGRPINDVTHDERNMVVIQSLL